MTSRVNKHLKLSADGRTVNVVGPIVTWEGDERSAVFSVEITQPPNGATVSARGRSTRTYHPSNTSWQANARVGDGPPLHVGPALAMATATITLANGHTEPYHWPVDVTLVHQVAPAAGATGAAEPIGTTR
jgi:hypothetical protein